MGLLPFANAPGSGGGGGTVTSVSVTTANGVSGSVANPTTTPGITITLGAIVPTSVNGLTLASQTTGFTIAGGTSSKTLTLDNTLELAGTDSTKMTFPSTSASIARTDAAQTFTGTQTFSSTISGSINGNAATVSNATLTTALTIDTGTVQISGNVANSSHLTLGAGASSVSGTNTGDQTSVSGNAGTATALQNARTIGGVSFDGTANITVASATGGFTVSGGNLALGTNSLTMTGSIGSTGARITKGWFTDLQVTNAIAGDITGNAATVTTNANLTGPITSSGNATSIASQTGTGTKFVVDTSPTLVTPNIGAATGTSLVLTNTSATGFAVGRQGSTNPVLNIDSSTASVVTGINLKGAAAAGGMAISVTSSGTNEGLKIDAKGSGVINLGSVSTGAVEVNGDIITTNTATQTLTNKTLTTPVISSISNTGTLTLPTSTDTLVGRATTDTLTNKTIDGASNTITGIWWEELGRVNYVSGSTMSLSGLTAKKYLKFIVHIIPTGGTLNIGIRFNGDSGANYAEAAAGSQTQINTKTAVDANTQFITAELENVAANEKVFRITSTIAGAVGAANVPADGSRAIKWANTSNQITEIDVVATGGTGSMSTNSQLIVLGHN